MAFRKKSKGEKSRVLCIPLRLSMISQLLCIRFFTVYLGMLIFIFISNDVVSQDIKSVWQGDTLRIDEVTIRASRSISETGIIKTKLDSVVMEEKVARSLAEMLAEHSPVFIKSYGRGSLATASFRGTTPSHTKVTWNGMEINSPMLGMVDFSLIPVYFADEVSLIHGAGSMQESSGALGGLITLNTKPNWSEKFSGRFVQGLGSYGSWDSFFKMHAGNSSFQSGTRIFYSQSANDFQFRNRDIIDSVNLESGQKYHPMQKNVNAGFTQYGVLQEFFYLPGNKNMLKFSFWGQKGERSIPFLAGNESGNDGGKNTQTDELIRMTGIWKRYAENLSFQYQTGLDIQDLSYRFENEIDGLGNISLINSASRSISFLNRAEWEYKPANMGLFQIRLGITKDLVDSYESISKSGYEQQRGHGSLMASWSLNTGKRLRAGINIGEEVSGNVWSPPIFNLRGEYHILDKERLFLRTSIARNVKFPGLNDLYYQPGGNPDLKMETGINREAGIEWAEVKGSQKINLSLTGYITDVKNWILWLPAFNGYWEPRNIERVEVSGIEASTGITGIARVLMYKLRLDYAYTRSRNLSPPRDPTDLSSGRQMPFIPLHSANATYNISREGWSLTWIWNYFSERFINSSNNYHSSRDYLYPYFMNQLTAGKSFKTEGYNGEFSVGIHNILNEEYRSILQRPMPGRNYTFMLKIGF